MSVGDDITDGTLQLLSFVPTLSAGQGPVRFVTVGENPLEKWTATLGLI